MDRRALCLFLLTLLTVWERFPLYSARTLQKNCTNCLIDASFGRKYHRLVQIKEKLKKELGIANEPQQIEQSNKKIGTLPDSIKRSFQFMMNSLEKQDLERENAIFVAKKASISSTFILRIPRKYFFKGNSVKDAKICIPGSGSKEKEPIILSVNYGQLKGFLSNLHTKILISTFTTEGKWCCFPVKKIFSANGAILFGSRAIWNRKAVVITFKINHLLANSIDLPYLLIKTVEKIVKHSKRDVSCRQGGKCCRHSLPIHFADIGLSDIIISPKHFDAYICKGECKKFSLHKSDRVEILKRYNRFVRGKHDKEPIDFCCSATKNSNLPILFKNGDAYLMKVVKDLVIEECGCI